MDGHTIMVEQRVQGGSNNQLESVDVSRTPSEGDYIEMDGERLEVLYVVFNTGDMDTVVVS